MRSEAHAHLCVLGDRMHFVPFCACHIQMQLGPPQLRFEPALALARGLWHDHGHPGPANDSVALAAIRCQLHLTQHARALPRGEASPRIQEASRLLLVVPHWMMNSALTPNQPPGNPHANSTRMCYTRTPNWRCRLTRSPENAERAARRREPACTADMANREPCTWLRSSNRNLGFVNLAAVKCQTLVAPTIKTIAATYVPAQDASTGRKTGQKTPLWGIQQPKTVSQSVAERAFARKKR